MTQKNNIIRHVLFFFAGGVFEVAIGTFVDGKFSGKDMLFIALVFLSLSLFLQIIESNLSNIKNEVKSIVNTVESNLLNIGNQVESRVEAIAIEVSKTARESREKTVETLSKLEDEAKYIRNIVDSSGKAEIEARYIKNDNEMKEDRGYQESLEKIREAKESILIIGDFSPEWMPLEIPKKRNDYLHEIDTKIQNAFEDDSIKNFKYARIIQRDLDIIKSIKNNNKTLLESHMVYDTQAFAHSYQVQELGREYRGKYRGKGMGVKVDILVSKPIPNIPSILLIDDELMLFTIPTPLQEMEGKNEAKEYIKTNGVLILRDLKEGDAFATFFHDIINSTIKQAVPVFVDKPSEYLLKEYKEG